MKLKKLNLDHSRESLYDIMGISKSEIYQIDESLEKIFEKSGDVKNTELAEMLYNFVRFDEEALYVLICNLMFMAGQRTSNRINALFD